MSEFRRLLQHHLNQTRAGLFGQFEHAFNFNTGADQNAALKIGPQEFVTFSGVLDDGSDTPFSLKVTNDLTGPSGEGFQCQTEDPMSATIVVGATPSKGQATLEFDAQGDTGPELPATSTLMYGAGLNVGSSSRFEALQLDWSVADPRIFIRNSIFRRAAELDRSFAGNYYAVESAGNANIFPTLLRSFDASNALRWSYEGLFQEAGVSVQHDVLNNVACLARREGVSLVSRVVGIDDAAADLIGSGNGAPELWQNTFGTRRVQDMKANDNGYVYVVIQRPVDDYTGGTSGQPKDLFKINTLTGDIEEAYNCSKTGNSDGGQIAIGPNGEVVLHRRNAFIPENPSDLSLELPSDLLTFDADLNLVARREIGWAANFHGGSFSRGRPVAVANDGTVYVSHGRVFSPTALPLTLVGLSSDLSTVLPNYPTSIAAAGQCADMVELNGELFLGGSTSSLTTSNPSVILRVDPASAVVTDSFFPSMPFINSMNGIEGDNIFLTSSEGNKATLFTQEPSSTPPGRIPCIAAVKYDAGNIVSVYFNSVDVEFKEVDFKGFHSVEGDFNIRASAPGWEYNTPL